MSFDWPVVRLGDYCLKVGSGATPKGGKSVYLESGGVALIRSQNVYNNGFNPKGLAYISEADAIKLSNVEVRCKDILLNITGDSVARVCLAPESYLPARVNQHVAIIRPSTDEFDARYLRYLLTTPEKQELLLTIASAGATRNALTKTQIETLDISKPDLRIQKIIADHLEAVEKKIQLNHQTNQTLEQMAQAIFKSWFVDFDPVKAKIAALEAGGTEEDAVLAAMQAISGKTEAELSRIQTDDPDKYAELRATAELFPSAMQGSELGEIPEGWDHVRLDQCIELAYGKALKKSDRIAGRYPVYGSGGVTGSHNTYLVSGPGVVIGRKGTVGSIYWISKDFYPIDTTYYVSVKNGYSLSFAYYFLQTLNLHSMNTDAAVPGLNRNNVYRLTIPNYPESIVKRFTKIVESLSTKMFTSNAESESLSELRDTLLPKLLSGELSVSGAETQFAEFAEPAHV